MEVHLVPKFNSISWNILETTNSLPPSTPNGKSCMTNPGHKAVSKEYSLSPSIAGLMVEEAGPGVFCSTVPCYSKQRETTFVFAWVLHETCLCGVSCIDCAIIEAACCDMFILASNTKE